MDRRLVGHAEYVEATSRRLARNVFGHMMKHQKKLEAKQAIINRVVDIGVELFAMSSVCTYTDHLIKNEKDKSNAIDLAILYLEETRKKVDRFFEDGEDNCDQAHLKVVKKILDEEFTWMEEGIVK